MALPDQVVGEIVAGTLHVSPRPAVRHAVAESALGAILLPPFHFGDNGPGGWWILTEPEIHLGDDVVVPDIAGWRRERMPTLPDGAFIETPPDWLVEVLSPSTARLDRVGKLPLYARAGVSHVWLIDPIAETLEILRLEQGRWVVVGLHAGDEVVQAEPFSELGIELRKLWGKD